MKLVFLFLCGLTLQVQAKSITHAFLSEVFSTDIPKVQRLVLTDDIKKTIIKLVGHPYPYRRIKFWKKAGKTVWILNEIGKTKKITAGFLIKNQQIEQTKVLAFRESRGGEVRYPFFTKQFKQATLNDDYQLNTYIDGITGATLSVRAMTKMARLALYLQQQLNLIQTSKRMF